jgi:hypothetical protein
MKPPNPTKLQWEFNSELLKKIDEAYNDGLAKIQVDQRFKNDILLFI